MITTTERKCTPKELEEKEEFIKFLLNRSPYYRINIFSLIIVWFISTLFLAIAISPIRLIISNYGYHAKPGLMVIYAFILGLIITFLFSIRYQFNRNKAKRKEIKIHQKDLKGRQIFVKKIENIEEVWDIDHLEDFGPGFVFKTEENEYCSLISQELIEFYPEENEEFKTNIIPKEVVFERWIASGREKGFKLNGKGIPKSGTVSINFLLDLEDINVVDKFFAESLYQFQDDLTEIINKHATTDDE